jgi:hypothetical protein
MRYATLLMGILLSGCAPTAYRGTALPSPCTADAVSAEAWRRVELSLFTYAVPSHSRFRAGRGRALGQWVINGIVVEAEEGPHAGPIIYSPEMPAIQQCRMMIGGREAVVTLWWEKSFRAFIVHAGWEGLGRAFLGEMGATVSARFRSADDYPVALAVVRSLEFVDRRTQLQ